MKRLSLIFGKLVSALTALAILAAAVFLVPGFWGIRPFVVLSGSMEPAVPTGSVAFVRMGDRDGSVGEIITYRLGEGENAPLITHRIVGIEDGCFITRGDANETADQVPVRPDQVEGTFLFHIPMAGYALAGWGPQAAWTAAAWLMFLNGTAMFMEAAGSGKEHSIKRGRRAGRTLQTSCGNRNEEKRNEDADDRGSLPSDGSGGAGRNHGLSDRP